MTEPEVIEAVTKAFGETAGGDAPCLGAWYNGVDTWFPAKWYADGGFATIGDAPHTPLDLIKDNVAQTA